MGDCTCRELNDVIRKHCLTDCCCDDPGELENCPYTDCQLHGYRMGIVFEKEHGILDTNCNVI